jgi:hypothetical protein
MESSEQLPAQQPLAPWWRRNITLKLVLLALAFSLVLHVLTWLVISHVRDLAREQLLLLAEQTQNAQGEVITVDIQLKQIVPVRASIPIEKQIMVPINTTVTINQQIEIPLDTPFGPYPIQVPLNMDIPVNLNVPVTFSETIEVSTTVDLDLDTPIALSLSDTTLSGYLDQLRAKLLELSERL